MSGTMIDHDDVLGEVAGVLLPPRNDHPGAVVVPNQIFFIAFLWKLRVQRFEHPEVLEAIQSLAKCFVFRK